jgi:hypothetical protein
MRYLNLPYVLLMCLLSLMSCNKDDAQSDIIPEPTDIHSGRYVPTWENLVNNESTTSEGTNIGVKYLGVRDWSALSEPPFIFVGAVYPESTYANYFDKDVTSAKHPSDIFFNFPNPYIGHMNKTRWVEYLQNLKDALKSDEYKSFKSPSQPYKFRLANLGSLSYIENLIPDNKKFAKALEDICRQTLKMDNVKSLTLGEVVFKGFSVTMDIPSKGIFIDPPTNIDNLVYIRELTYGTSAYFVIASDHRFQDVLDAFKSSFVDAYEREAGALNKSQIRLLTISDISQEGIIKGSFGDLKTFMKDPFENGKQYGYPILCKGYRVKDNSVFVQEKK